MLGGAGEATLVDFGLSRISARHVTRTPWFTPATRHPRCSSASTRRPPTATPSAASSTTR
ncbi:hypothetical protein ACFQXA_08380 [Nocardiopsis composta]